jgi:hypothetical protein
MHILFYELLCSVWSQVNVDTVEDLLVELRLLLQASQQSTHRHGNAGGGSALPGGSLGFHAKAQAAPLAPLPLDAALNCVKCAMRTLRGGGGEGLAK